MTSSVAEQTYAAEMLREILDARKETKLMEIAASAAEVEPEVLRPEGFITATDVAQVLNVHENWVYDQASRGDLPSYKIKGLRRFRWSEVEAWVSAE
jgi:excisionase family DNA binding protein